MKAIDTSAPTTGQLQKIKDQGIQAVGIYLRPDRCTKAMVEELRNGGIKVWSTYEKGHPEKPSYFSTHQGKVDGSAAAQFAKNILNQPEGTLIFATVDWNPDPHDPDGPTIRGVISDYMTAFKAAVEASGYLAGVYGSGRTCRILIASGLAKAGWLCESSSYAEHDQYRPNAAIVQIDEINDDWDNDEVQNAALAGLW